MKCFFVNNDNEEIKHSFCVPFTETETWVVEQSTNVLSSSSEEEYIFEGGVLSTDTEEEFDLGVVKYSSETGAYYLHAKNNVLILGEIAADSKLTIVGNIHTQSEGIKALLENINT